MANPSETCVVTCNGEKFDTWSSVHVSLSNATADAQFVLTVAEPSPNSGWDQSKLRPGDEVTITLGGIKVLTGLVYVRQAAMNATSHATQIQGLSKTHELVISSHVPKSGGGSYDGNTFEQIARSVGKPYGVGFSWNRMPKGADKPFRFVQTMIGESSFSFLERLARQRGVIFHADESGDLKGTDGKPDDDKQSAMLEEGKNIVSIVAMLQHSAPDRLGVIGSQPGNDNAFGKKASQVKAEATDPSVGRYRPLIMVAEEPVAPDEAQRRADREMEQVRWEQAQFMVVVQGWFRPDGEIWRPGQPCTVKSPSTVPTKGGIIALQVQTVAFAQDAAGGSTTTLGLVLDLQGQGGVGQLPTQPGSTPNVLTSAPTSARTMEPSNV